MQLPKFPYSHETIVQHCKMLQESEGWKIVVMQIETKIEALEERMWSETPYTESQMLRMRDEHRVLLDLLQQPQNLIDLYSQEIEEIDHEIYD